MTWNREGSVTYESEGEDKLQSLFKIVALKRYKFMQITEPQFQVYYSFITGCSGKFVFLPTATPPSPNSLEETFKALNAMRVYSHFYWLTIFCTTNSIREFLEKKHNI